MLIKEFSSYQTLLASQNDKSVKYWKIPNDTHYQETLNQGLTLPLRVTLSTTDGHLDIQISTSRYLLKCRLNILGCCWGWWPEAKIILCALSVYLLLTSNTDLFVALVFFFQYNYVFQVQNIVSIFQTSRSGWVATSRWSMSAT